MNITTYKTIENNLGYERIVLRYIDLSLTLYKCYSHFEDNRMLYIRIE